MTSAPGIAPDRSSTLDWAAARGSAPSAGGPPHSEPEPPATLTGSGTLGLPLLAAAATMLTATGMARVFDGFAWWFLPSVGGVLVVLVCGLLARLVRVPTPLVPLVYAAGLALYLPAISAPDTRRAFLPTGTTVQALRELINDGIEDVRRLAVPVPDRPGLILLVVLGTYAVACAVDLICTRLRTPAAAGLPLLALIAVPAAIVPGDVGLRPFLASAAGYLLLLAADGHRLLTARASEGAIGSVSGSVPGSGGFGSGPGGADPVAGRQDPGAFRIGVLALLAALLVPAVLPGPGHGLLAPRSNTGGDGLGGPDDGRARVVQPFVTLNQQLRSSEVVPLMRVRTDTPEYLRLTALDIFDGSRFSLSRLQADPNARVSKGLPPPPSVPSTTASGQIRVRDVYRQRYLPLPYTPTAIDVSGDWRLHGPTGTVFSGRTDTGGTHYSYTAAVPAPTAAQLRGEPVITVLPSEIGVDLRLPGLDPDVRRLAQQLTRDQPTVYDKVAAIQQYLRSPLFTYDLNGAPTNGRGALRTFLLESHRGYCEQFASAMAVLVRAIGIPARVAIGFTPGSRDSSGDWVITNRDAHAWPEVWFPNAGWIRFEPTPRDDSAEVTPDYSVPPPVTGPNSGVADEGGSTGATGPSSPSKPDERVTNGAGSGALPLNPALGAKRRDASWGWDVTGVVAGLVILAALTPPLVRLRRRRRRFTGAGPTATPSPGHRLGWSVRSGSARPSGSAPVGGSGATPDSARLAWQEVADTALDLGILPSLTASPRATAGRWATHLVDIDVDGTMSTAALRLGAVEERARYGGQSPAEIKPVIEDAQLLVSGLERSSRRRDRLRAWLLPRSLLRAATIRARGWQEGLAARLRRHRPAMGFGPRAD